MADVLVIDVSSDEKSDYKNLGSKSILTSSASGESDGSKSHYFAPPAPKKRRQKKAKKQDLLILPSPSHEAETKGPTVEERVLSSTIIASSAPRKRRKPNASSNKLLNIQPVGGVSSNVDARGLLNGGKLQTAEPAANLLRDMGTSTSTATGQTPPSTSTTNTTTNTKINQAAAVAAKGQSPKASTFRARLKENFTTSDFVNYLLDERMEDWNVEYDEKTEKKHIVFTMNQQHAHQ